MRPATGTILVCTLCVLTAACANPVAPTPTTSAAAMLEESLPIVSAAPTIAALAAEADAAIPVPLPRPIVLPKNTTKLMRQIRFLTQDALQRTRRTAGMRVEFEIHELGLKGATVHGSLRRRGARDSGERFCHLMILPNGALQFSTKAELLAALDAAVYYEANIRVKGAGRWQHLDKPPIRVTGSIEAEL